MPHVETTTTSLQPLRWSLLNEAERIAWAEKLRASDKHWARFTADELVEHRNLTETQKDLAAECEGYIRDIDEAKENLEVTQGELAKAEARLAEHQAEIEGAADERCTAGAA